MRMKKEYIVLAVVIVGLVAYLVSRNQDRNLYDLPQIESVQAKEITRIELTMAKGGVMFTKEGSDWKIVPENYSADPQKVKDMLAVVEGLTLTELISESKNYQRYDLDAKDGVRLKCWINDDLRFELLIGKSAGSFNHTFVKLPEDEAVYHAKGNFRNTFDMEKGEFREKTVLVFDKETIGAVEIRAGETVETYISVKAAASSAESEGAEKAADQNPGKEPKWMDSKGEEAAADKIKNLISAFAGRTSKDLLRLFTKPSRLQN